MKTGKALIIGHLWVTIPTILSALVSFIPGLYLLLELKLNPLWIFPLLILPLAVGIAVYSFLIVKWKIWALSRVRNVYKLAVRGFDQGLFYPKGSIVRKTEILSAKDRKILDELYKRFEEPIP